MNRSLLLLTIMLLLLWSCKTSKVTQSTTPPTDSVFIAIEPKDTIQMWITQKGDTLTELNQEVSIEISRVLPDTITIASVGDIMIGTDFPNKSYLPSNNGYGLWDSSREILKNADITFGNLEGTVLDGPGDQKECKNPDACYLFRMPSRLTSNLVDCGFDLMSVANNHANDFGEIGRKSTQAVLDSLGITSAGSVEKPYTTTKINGIKVGFVAFAPNKGTLTFYDTAQAISIIKELKRESDIILVSIHGGAEGNENMHVTRKTEFYYGEDRGNIYEFAHLMINHGADLIIGHGPHVPRAVEVYKNRIIAYSLGNFCTYGRFNLKGANAEAPLLITNVDAEGKFLSGDIIAFRQGYSSGPKLDVSMKVVQTISRLSEEDFPENEIFIDDNGRIIYLQN